MIRVVGVTQHYGVRPVLKDVSLDIPAGTRTAIVGPNGIGKSTLLSVMGGVLSPQRGYIEINGMRRRSSVETELEIRRQAVFLPDRAYLPRDRTGREYLMGVGRVYGRQTDELIDHTERLLKLFQLDPLGDTPIRSYSAGQQKKISLSSALITNASVYLLDEPFSGGLDPAGIFAFRRVMERLVQQQRTIVLTTPVPELIDEIADRLVILRDGQVDAHGTLAEVVQHTGGGESFEQLIQRRIFAEVHSQIEEYFAGEQA